MAPVADLRAEGGELGAVLLHGLRAPVDEVAVGHFGGDGDHGLGVGLIGRAGFLDGDGVHVRDFHADPAGRELVGEDAGFADARGWGGVRREARGKKKREEGEMQENPHAARVGILRAGAKGFSAVIDFDGITELSKLTEFLLGGVSLPGVDFVSPR
jgi:hypothetical protein